MKNETSAMRQKQEQNIYNFTACATVTPTGQPNYDNLINHLNYTQDFICFKVHYAVCIKKSFYDFKQQTGMKGST